MKSFQLLALFGALVGYAHSQQSQSQYPSGALGSSYSSSISTTPRPLPPAQVHYVNIGEDLTGDYKFGYDTGKNDGGQSFREESRLPDGTVKGAYGYIDAEGKQRIVKYTAGVEGFKVESDEAAPGHGAPRAPAPVPVQTYTPRAQPPTSYQLPPQSQSLGGYTPVSSQQARYAPPPPPTQSVARPAPSYVPSSQPSPLPNYSAALQAQLAAAQASGARPAAPSVSYQPQQQAPAYTATLAQRQPTLTQVRPSHLASIPRTSSSSGASLASYGSTFGSQAALDQESTTWGPPVINKELLSYNIGVGRR